MAFRPSVSPLQALLSQGYALHQAGQLEQAASLYRQALSLNAESVEALNLLAVLHLQWRDLQGFVDLARRSLRLHPQQPPLLGNLGTALQELKRHDEALAAFDEAIALDQAHRSAHYNRGLCLLKLKRPAEALAGFDRQLALQPQHIPALISRGNALQMLGRLEEALQSFDQLIALDPASSDALYNRGNVLRDMRRLDEARSSYELALRRVPDHLLALINLGLTLDDLQDFDAAVLALTRAVAIDPRSVQAHNNLGNVFWSLGKTERAGLCFERALELQPGSIDALWNNAIVKLALGHYKEGWRLYDEGLGYANRRGVARVPRRWDGRPLDGQRLLIRCEQGLGDSLQFVRYAALCKDKGARVLLQCPRPLQRLLRYAPGVDVVVEDVTDQDFDWAIELMSLPLVFGTTLETVPASVPYLYADDSSRAKWAARMAGEGRPQIGLVWAGAPRENQPNAYLIDRRRSLHLSALLPLLEVEGLRFHSLQLGSPATQIEELGLQDRVETHHHLIEDYLDTAAILEQLDLVISVDTSVVHAAGALGRPVWVLSRRDACWRWLGNRPDNPWYPTARVFGQPAPGDWASVIAEVGAALHAWRDRGR
jgi:tetratricopeptide (TPR) repeat protein